MFSRIGRRVWMRALGVLSLMVLSGSISLRGADRPVSLGVAGRANANVSLASSGPFVAAVWSATKPDGDADVYAALSRDGGVTFASPVRVNSTAGQVNVNGEQPPRVALAAATGRSTPDVVVVWTAKGEKGTRLLTARSSDVGQTFSRTTLVPGGEAAGNRGWQAVTADAAGRVSVTWLDHRAMAEQGDKVAASHHDMSHGEAGKIDGVAMAQRSHIYFAAVGDPASVRGLTGGVCYCCKTAIALGSTNTIALAWRHVYAGNLRDIAFSLSRDNGQTFSVPVRVSEDKWQLEGCPDDGPTMAIDSQGAVHIAWPTLVTDAGGTPTIGLFYAASRDGKAFGNRVRIATEGVPHHPQMTMVNDRLSFAWDEVVNGRRRVVFAAASTAANGGITFARQVLSGDESGTYPMLVAAGDGTVVGWTSGAADAAVIRIARVGAGR